MIYKPCKPAIGVITFLEWLAVELEYNDVNV